MSLRVAVAFFGDGATNIGTFHEVLNMAAVWSAPAVFVCENNLYGEYSPIARRRRSRTSRSAPSSYGMPGEIVDGNDVDAVQRGRAAWQSDRARAGEAGRRCIECKTYRLRGHSRSDPAPTGLRVSSTAGSCATRCWCTVAASSRRAS